MDYSITCHASYPYPSSSCVGTFEVRLVMGITNRHVITAAMGGITSLCGLFLSTLRLGMRTADGERPRRGYLGLGGSSQYFLRTKMRSRATA